VAKASTKPEVPEFQSDRLRLLGTLITPRIIELAHYRLMGGALIAGKGIHQPICAKEPRAVLKIALLLVLEMNPHERFTVEEEGLMRGMDADNVNKHKKENLIRPF